MTDFGNADRRDSNADPGVDRRDRRAGHDPGRADARVAALRADLEEKDARIAELEAELAAAQEFGGLAEEFVDAVRRHLEASHSVDADRGAGRNSPLQGRARGGRESDRATSGMASDDETDDAFAAFGAMMGDEPDETAANGTPDGTAANGTSDTADANGTSDTAEGLAALAGIGDDGSGPATNGDSSSTAVTNTKPTPAPDGGGLTVRSISTEVAEFEDGVDALAGAGEESPASGDGRPSVVVDIEDVLSDLDEVGRAMLARYRSHGPDQPEAAYQAVADEADRVAAYERNRTFRRAGLVEHVGRGHYDYSLRSRIAMEVSADRGKSAGIYARDLEQQFLD